MPYDVERTNSLFMIMFINNFNFFSGSTCINYSTIHLMGQATVLFEYLNVLFSTDFTFFYVGSL